LRVDFDIVFWGDSIFDLPFVGLEPVGQLLLVDIGVEEFGTSGKCFPVGFGIRDESVDELDVDQIEEESGRS
jgi:hypothetical protein